MTGSHIETIRKLLVETGQRYESMLDEKMRGIHAEAIECDELWTFVQKKQRQLTDDDRVFHPEFGDAYAFVAFDPVSKAVVNYKVGKRDAVTAWQFISDLRQRVVGRPQISTDAFRPYIDAIERAFGSDVDYAQIIKLYAAEHPGPGRYSPPHVTGTEIRNITGTPVKSKVCTSYVERNNLTIRMQLRRSTRLTNAFSRKLENLRAALALYFYRWNFCWIPRTTRVTPAMAAGITNSIWTLEELAA